MTESCFEELTIDPQRIVQLNQITQTKDQSKSIGMQLSNSQNQSIDKHSPIRQSKSLSQQLTQRQQSLQTKSPVI